MPAIAQVDFDHLSEYIVRGEINFNDTFALALITTLPTQNQPAPKLTDFTEVAGVGYTPGGIDVLSPTISRTLDVTTFGSVVQIEWQQDDAGPANIVAALLYDKTSPTKEAVSFMDLRDGVTPISLINGDVRIRWNVAGILRLQRKP